MNRFIFLSSRLHLRPSSLNKRHFVVSCETFKDVLISFKSTLLRLVCFRAFKGFRLNIFFIKLSSFLLISQNIHLCFWNFIWKSFIIYIPHISSYSLVSEGMNDFVENLSITFALFLLLIFFLLEPTNRLLCDGLEQWPPDKKTGLPFFP